MICCMFTQAASMTLQYTVITATSWAFLYDSAAAAAAAAAAVVAAAAAAAAAAATMGIPHSVCLAQQLSTALLSVC